MYNGHCLRLSRTLSSRNVLCLNTLDLFAEQTLLLTVCELDASDSVDMSLFRNPEKNSFFNINIKILLVIITKITRPNLLHLFTLCSVTFVQNKNNLVTKSQ